MRTTFRTRASALLGAVVIAAAVAIFAVGTPAQASSGWSEIFNRGTGKCLSATLGGLIVQKVCDGSPSEMWAFAGTPGSIRLIENRAIDGCAFAAGNYNGAPIYMESCFVVIPPDSNLLWLVNVVPPAIPPAEVVMFQVFTNMCLDLENGSGQDGVPMQIWTCNSNTNNQKWDVYPL